MSKIYFLERVRCPACGRKVSISVHGYFRNHQKGFNGFYDRMSGKDLCENSGKAYRPEEDIVPAR